MSDPQENCSASNPGAPVQTGDEKSAVVNITPPLGLQLQPPSFTVQRQPASNGEATQEKKLAISTLTQRQYAGHVEVFRDWLRAKGFPTDFEHRPPKELNDSLVQFYQESETRTGCKRKASSLRIIRTGIDHHLQGEPYCWPHSLTRSANFMNSNAVLHQLENMQKEEALLPSEARKNMVAVKQEDIRKLWSSGVIGINRPKPLQRLVFLVIGVNFGITSRDFLHDLAADVFEFGTDETTGLEYVQCKAIRPEESHKQLSKRTKCSSKKVFSLPGCVQCPVSALKLYLKKRNPECTAFFQVPYRDIVVGCPDSVLWYRAEATGVNTLSRMMKDMSEEAGLSMNYTNNALRTTSPVALFEGIADCSVRNLPIKSCGLQLYDQSVSCQNRASGIEQTAAPIQMSVNPSLSVKWHVPILPRPLSREPAPEPCNGERTFESTGTANNSTELCLPKILSKTQPKPASCGDEQVVSTAPRPVLCIPQQWQIKDIIAALNSGEALLLAKQPAAKKQDHLHANDISSAVPAPSRSSRKQPDPKRLRREPQSDQEAACMTQEADISWMEAIMGLKSRLTVLEELIETDSPPTRESIRELEQLRGRLNSILAQVHPLDCDDL